MDFYNLIAASPENMRVFLRQFIEEYKRLQQRVSALESQITRRN